ncbi:MAG: hypothetical protein P4L87_14250, partial [Formivibrio sp.]|nr:hypothetical protein [Formivibrio sp.]
MNQTAQLVLSDTKSGGILQVGEYQLDVQSMPPVRNYRTRELGRIPRKTQLHVEEVCLVQSKAMVDQLAAASNTPSTATIGRRLLQLDTQSYEQSTTDAKLLYYRQWCTTSTYGSFRVRAKMIHDGNAGDGTLWVWDDLLSLLKGLQTYFVGVVSILPGEVHAINSGILALAGGIDVNELWYEDGDKNLILDQAIKFFDILQMGRPLTDNADTKTFWQFSGQRKSEVYPYQALTCASFPGNCFTQGFTESIDRSQCITPSDISCGETYPSMRQNLRIACQRFKSMAPNGAVSQSEFDAYKTNMTNLLSDVFNKTALNDAAIKSFENQTLIALHAIQNLTAQQEQINTKIWDIQATQILLNQNFINQSIEFNNSLQVLWNSASQAVNQTRHDLLTAIAGSNAQIQTIGHTLLDITDRQSSQFEQLYSGILALGQSVQEVAAELSHVAQQTQFMRLMTASYYQSVDALYALGQDEVPLVSLEGIRPGVLVGDDLRAFLDSIVVTYTRADGSIVIWETRYYLDTEHMLALGQPWITQAQLFIWLSPASNQCTILSTQSTDACIMWAISKQTVCSSGAYNPSDLSCIGGMTTQSPPTTFTNMLSLLGEFTTHCNDNINRAKIFTVASTLSSIQTVVTQGANYTLCNATIQDQQLQLAKTGKPGVFMASFMLLLNSYTGPFQLIMKSLELKRYGRLPNGIKTELQPLGYTPSMTTNYDGGRDKIQCMKGYWVSASSETIPITSITYDSSSDINEEIHLHISSAPTCTPTNGNTTDTQCYIVTDSDLRVNFNFLQTTILSLPSQLVVAGDTSLSHLIGVFDIPESLIETGSNPLVRANKVSYLLMPPQTTRTLTFDFFNTMSGFLFDPVAATASSDDYRHTGTLDRDGYPYCSLPGSEPARAVVTLQGDDCAAPYVWSGLAYRTPTTLPSPTLQYTAAPPLAPGGAAVCVSNLGTITSAFILNELRYGSNTVSQPGQAAMQSSLQSYAVSTPLQFTFSWWFSQSSDAITSDLVEFPVLVFDIDMLVQISGSWYDQYYVMYIGMNQGKWGFSLTSVSGAYPQEWYYGGDASNFQSGRAYHLAFTHNSITEDSYFMKDGVISQVIYGATAGPMLTTIRTWKRAAFTLRSPQSYRTSYTVDAVSFYGSDLNVNQVLKLKKCEAMSLTPRCWLSPAAQLNATSSVYNSSQVDPLSKLRWAPSSPNSAPIELGLSLELYQAPRFTCEASTNGRLLRGTKGLLDQSMTTASLHNHTAADPTSLTMFVTPPTDPRLLARYNSFYRETGFEFGVEVEPLDAYSMHFLAVITTGSTCTQYRSLNNSVLMAWPRWWPHNTPGASSMYVTGVKFIAAEFQGMSLTISVISDSATLSETIIGQTCQTSQLPWVLDPASVDMTTQYADSVYVYPRHSITSLFQEMQCQLQSWSLSANLQSTLRVLDYSPPAAVCVYTGMTDELGVARGYCRHGMMCQGHCNVYGVLDLTNKLVTAVKLTCDAGYAMPDCTKKCAFQDSMGRCTSENALSSGQQSTSVLGIADAYSSNGHWCQVLKYYQVSESMVDGNRFMSFTPREYQYFADVTLPNGRITSVIPRGNCPSVELEALGDGTTSMAYFTNSNANYSTIRIDLHDASCNAALSTCCSHKSYPVTLPPNRVTSWSIPSICNRQQMQVNLDLGNGLLLCQKLNSTAVGSLLDSTTRTLVPANVQRTITYATDDALTQVANTNRQLASLLLDLQQAALKSILSGIDNSEEIRNMTLKIATVQNSTDQALSSYSDPFTNNTAWNQYMQDIKLLQQQAVNLTSQASTKLTTLADLNSQYTNLSRRLDVDMVNLDASWQVRLNTSAELAATLNQAVARLQVLATPEQFNNLMNFLDNGGYGNTAASTQTDSLRNLFIAGSIMGIVAGSSIFIAASVRYGPTVYKMIKEALR